jgi:hypothetical protein
LKTTTKRLLGVLAIAIVLVAGGLVARKFSKRAKHALNAQLAPVSTGPRQPQPLEVAEMIYDQKLSAGWDDWGWGPHQLGNGPAKIVFQNYGGWLLHHADLPWRFGGVSFRYKAPAQFGEFLLVSLRQSGKPDDAFPVVSVEARHIAAVDGWQEVLVDWKELNPDRMPFDRLLIGSRAKVGPEWVELDRVLLTKAGAQDTQQGSLRVLCNGESHPISDLIYGSATRDWESGQTAQRVGGNPLSRAHWELGTWNKGADWYFENGRMDETLLQTLDKASRDKRRIAMVVPMIGWVAKDATSVGFPRSKFGAQRQHDPYNAEAGDGFRPDGTAIRPGDPSETSVPLTPELVGTWVSKVLAQDARNGSRSIHMYILDNEPTLWNVTHRDVHPDPLSYDELLDRTIKYASAIRQADPQAVIAGPAEWGFTGYQYSAVDREAGTGLRPDRRAHGDVPLVAWYLKKLAEHEKATGQRLLDVFDLHFYPAADGLYGGNAGVDPVKAELRVRATRALWDPEYVDESWINEKLRLIPRMKDWVRENYPGRKLSLGEWSFGAPEHISGGVATAEALGRFGQQGLDAAFHWGELKEGTPVYWAFRAFRNFDGRGARFQDVSLATRDMAQVSLFASRDPGSTQLVMVLVNRDPTVRVATRIELDGCGNATSSRLFRYAADSKGLVEESSDLKASLSPSLEPFSFAVIEVKLGKNAQP